MGTSCICRAPRLLWRLRSPTAAGTSSAAATWSWIPPTPGFHPCKTGVTGRRSVPVWTTEMLPRWLRVTEEEIEEGEMSRKEYQPRREWWDWSESTRNGFLRSHHFKFMLGLVLFFAFWFWLFDFPFAWGNHCNGDTPILCGCSRVSLRAEPCGDSTTAMTPSHWEVTIDHQEKMLLQNMRILDEEGMWIPLGDNYRLHPGSNLIEFRAVRNGYITGPTESVLLSFGTEIPPPEMGRYTITEVRGEGN